MALTNKGLVEFAKQMLALGDDTLYVYGSFGRTLTESLINQKAIQYAYNFPRKSLYKEIMDSKGTEYAFDCVGLIKAYYWNWKDGKTDYKSSQDKSANGMLSAAKVKGKIATMPEVPGLLVHMSGHIGIYIGGGYVIECTPTTSFAKQSHGAGGVCKTKLTARKWTSWLECPFIDYIDDEPEEKNETVTNVETYKLNTTVNIYMNAKNAKNRKSSKGKYAKGTYYVYHKADGMINITKTKGVPGAWINPADNVVNSNTYVLKKKVNIYMSSTNAKNRKNSVGKYYAGTYYIFSEANGMINITKDKKSAGAWINPADNK